MKRRFSMNHNDVLRRFLFVLCVILQCTIIKRGNAFCNVGLTSSTSRVMKIQSKHLVVATQNVAHQSSTIPLMMALSGNGDDPASSISTMLLIASAATSASQTEAWVQPLSNVLDPFLNFMSFAMLSRVVLSWYPEIIASNNNNSNNSGNDTPPPKPQQQEIKMVPLESTTTATESMEPNVLKSESDSTTNTSNSEKASLPIWITLIVIPTQPFLRAVKDIVPPAFGVDVTPVFWLAIFTFIHEILLGQQGLLTMKIKYGI